MENGKGTSHFYSTWNQLAVFYQLAWIVTRNWIKENLASNVFEKKKHFKIKII